MEPAIASPSSRQPLVATLEGDFCMDAVEDSLRAAIARCQIDDLNTDGLFGPSAMDRILAVARNLEHADAADLYGDRAKPSMRRLMRFLCTLMPPHIDDEALPIAILTVVGNRHLTLGMVTDIIEGRGDEGAGELPGRTLRVVANLLRDGVSIRQAGFAVGVCQQTVEKVSTFLAIPEAREERLFHRALAAVAEGRNANDFAADENVARSVAQRVMRRARDEHAALEADLALDRDHDQEDLTAA